MKINYHSIYKDTLARIKEKQKLLLHVCCGPCSANALKELHQYFEITILFSNSNIYPETEYTRRKDELIIFIEKFMPDITIIEKPYKPAQFLQQLSVLGPMKEGDKRCYLCYSLRMEDARKYANDNQFDYWTTVLSISPHKNSQWINEIGKNMSNDTCKFLHSDFKKDNGYRKSTEISKEYDLYRQNYCGCIYSYQDMIQREKMKDELL